MLLPRFFSLSLFHPVGVGWVCFAFNAIALFACNEGAVLLDPDCKVWHNGVSMRNESLAVEAVDLPVVLTIAGSDSGGSAGIQADLHAFAANNVFGTTAITCVTAQNPLMVSDYQVLDCALIRGQMERVFEYFPIEVAKMGMLGTADVVEVVSQVIAAQEDLFLVIDPVAVATSGARLLDDAAIHAMKTKLFPLASLITPNLDELEIFTGIRAHSPQQMILAGQQLAAQYGCPVLVKGGHLATEILTDFLVDAKGEVLVQLETPRLAYINTHGSGCTYSAAIVANLAQGMELPLAVRMAHSYLQQCMRLPICFGDQAFIYHYATAVNV